MDLFGETQEDTTIYDGSEGHENIAIENSRACLCDPKEMTFCLGHEEQEAMFLDLFKKNNIPHAMIFSGLEGIGKTTMAFRLARFLLKNGMSDIGNNNQKTEEISSLDVDSSDPVFRLIASRSHPDFLHIYRNFDKSKGKKDAMLKVESVRRIEPFLRKTSSEGGWRVVIVEDADTMNHNAQNAILKILEEPPANVLIILIAHCSGLLIPTIHSRSRNIKFAPLSTTVIEALLSYNENAKNLSSNDIEILSSLSEGSIGQVIKFIEQDGLDMLERIFEHIQYVMEEKNYKIHEFSASISKPSKDVQYRMFTYIFLWILRKILFFKARGYNEVPLSIKNDTTNIILNKYSVESLVVLNDNVSKLFERVDFSNLDRRDAVRSAFLMISQ